MISSRALLGAALALAVSAGLLAPSRADAAGHVLFGAYVHRTYSGQTDSQQVATLEAFLGRKLAIDHVGFYAWSAAFPVSRMKQDVAAGRSPLISWKQASSTDITSGSLDAAIRGRADALKSVGGRVFLQFSGEMDRLKTAGTPSQFIAAWRHVRAIFKNRGATNVRFVWCPTAYGFQSDRAAAYYPADWAVDWLCADGYNWGPQYRPAFGWRTFGQIFGSFISWAAAHPRPILIGEWASVEDPNSAGRKASWLNDARSYVENHSQIQALSYFDTIGWDESTNRSVDWRAQTSSSAYNAFKQMALDTYFSAR
jgi:hypothetical protein